MSVTTVVLCSEEIVNAYPMPGVDKQQCVSPVGTFLGCGGWMKSWDFTAVGWIMIM